MKPILISIALAVSVLILLVANLVPNSSLQLGLVGNAEAIIGLPFTPFSIAGAARRSMYREAAWNAAAINAASANAAAANAAAANYAYANAAAAQAAAANAAAAQAAAANAAAAAAAAHAAQAALPIGSTVPYLPPNCTSSLINGINYFNCNGVFYRAGFQGNQVVYIVSKP